MTHDDLPAPIQKLVNQTKDYTQDLQEATNNVPPSAVVTSEREASERLMMVPLGSVPEKLHAATINYLRRRNDMVIFFAAVNAFAADISSEDGITQATLKEHPDRMRQYVKQVAEEGKHGFKSDAIAMAVYFKDLMFISIYTLGPAGRAWHDIYGGPASEAPAVGGVALELPPEPTEEEKLIFATMVDASTDSRGAEYAAEWMCGGGHSFAEGLLAAREGMPLTVEMPVDTASLINALADQLVKAVKSLPTGYDELQ
jgi:hypothetical protein